MSDVGVISGVANYIKENNERYMTSVNAALSDSASWLYAYRYTQLSWLKRSL